MHAATHEQTQQGDEERHDDRWDLAFLPNDASV